MCNDPQHEAYHGSHANGKQRLLGLGHAVRARCRRARCRRALSVPMLVRRIRVCLLIRPRQFPVRQRALRGCLTSDKAGGASRRNAHSDRPREDRGSH